MLRNPPHSLVEREVLSVDHGLQLPASASSFVIYKHTGKEKKARLLCRRTFSSLQQEQEPRQASQGSSQRQSAQTQMELLEKLTLGRGKGMTDIDKNTIAEQLLRKATVSADETVVRLGKQIPQEYDDLTLSQKRNIRRQKYLDQVSQRNDAPLFTAIALFVIVPPAVILGVAAATGYINFLP